MTMTPFQQSADRSSIVGPSGPGPNARCAGGWWRELVSENPLIDEARREQRRFFRTAAGVGTFGPILACALFALFYLWLVVESAVNHQDLATPYSYLALGLITLIVPGSIYGAVSGEREKSTWEALILTRLTPAQIIAGKLLWRLRIIGLIIAGCILPALASRMIAVTWDEPVVNVLRANLLIACWGILLCSFGLWVSALTLRSITSLAVIAGSLIGLLVALPVLYAMFTSLTSSIAAQDDAIYALMMELNPFTLLTNVLVPPPGVNFHALALMGHTGLPQCAIYLVTAAALIYLTRRRLKRLETPSRRSR